MAKLIKKSKCRFENGYIVTKKNKIVGVSYEVWNQLACLERMIQEHDYLLAQPKAKPMPTLEGFKMKHMNRSLPYFVQPETPTMDARVAEAMAFCEEVETVDNTIKVNEMIDRFAELIRWVASDTFIPGNSCDEFDLYNLGNPLELTVDRLLGAFLYLVENPIDTGDVDGDCCCVRF